jgi:CO/xanthine dehydrogenase Mo-binding subunit
MPAKKNPAENPDSPVGDSVIRLDAREKATGSAIFADDYQFGPNLLHARIVRSPHAHALIKKIDVSKALALPGVKVVVTGESYDGMLGLYLSDRYIFCRDRVRYVGDAVAGIAATSEEIAERATRLVEVEYEVLPPVFDPEEGVKPEAPLLHPDLGSYAYPNFIFPEPGTNIANRFKVRKGDVDEAFKHCAAVVERRYKVPQIQHVPIEPHVAIAQADGEGNITLWASSQSPFAQRNLIAKALHISQSKLRVIAPYVGGGFGSKAGVSMEALSAAIALKIPGRPVRLVLTREEEFFASFCRQGLVAYYKMGCDKDGNLIAVDNKYYWDAGAYTEYGVNITRASGYSSTGPYNVPNVRVDSLCVYTNHPVGGPMRGFGMPEIHVGLEQCVDDLAHKIGIDPVEFRRKNCVKGGDIIVTGMVMHPTGLTRCIEQAAKAIQWGSRNAPSGPNKKRGKGIAVMWKAPAMPPNAGSSAWVRLNEDATVEIGLGGQELGQGTFTVMAQMAAAALGVPYEWVKVARPVDTKYSPYEWQTVASRLTWSMGNAVRNAALDARKQVLDLVAQAWEEKVDDLDIKDGYVISYRSEETISMKNIVVYGIAKKNDQGWMGGPIVGRGQFMPSYVTGLDRETGQGPRAVVHYTTGAQAVEVEVDLTTGRVEIVDASSAFDVGHAINPNNVHAQMEGGFVQGLSSALLEAMQFNKDGSMRNPSFVDYRIATSADAPSVIKTIIVEEPQDDGPWGARGIGEHSMVPTIPAIANAIYDAIGIRVGNPPFTPERVFLAMLEAGIVK